MRTASQSRCPPEESKRGPKREPNRPVADESTTPPGSPPPGLPGLFGGDPRNPQPQAPAHTAPPNLMEMLASIAKQTATPSLNSAANMSALSTTIPPPQATLAGAAAMPQASAYSSAGLGLASTPLYVPPQQTFGPNQPPTLPTSMPAFPTQLIAGLTAPPPSNSPVGFPGILSGAPPASAPAATPAGGLSQVLLIKSLIDQGLQPDQISAIIQTMNQATAQPGQSFPHPPPQPLNGSWPTGNHQEIPRDHGVDERHRFRDRSRSRSPNRWGGRDSRAPHDKYGRDRGQDSDHGREREPDYRHRSPVGRRSPNDNIHDRRPKMIEFDRTLHGNKIKVLSRTLFVGGVK